VLQQHAARQLAHARVVAPPRGELRLRFARGLFVVADRFGVVAAEHHAVLRELGGRQLPRQVDPWRRQGREFRHPAAHEGAFGVLVEALLHRVVDARDVDAGDAALHLHLGPVDAGLVVGELPRKV
jgi:hypothetical protein